MVPLNVPVPTLLRLEALSTIIFLLNRLILSGVTIGQLRRADYVSQNREIERYKFKNILPLNTNKNLSVTQIGIDFRKTIFTRRSALRYVISLRIMYRIKSFEMDARSK